MGGHWIVQEGYLQVKSDELPAGRASSPTMHLRSPVKMVERYAVLAMNRKLEIYETSTKERRVDACTVRAFSGWDGHGFLKAGDAYGLELKVERKSSSPHTRLLVAAFNRLDLDKWCRGFVAALDPESAAGQEVRRERRKARREEKRLKEEKEAKIQQWKEQRRKMIEEEKLRLQAREEEILNMTPLERIDDIGSLDDNTARMLEKRKQRLQRRQAPTTRRVNKAAYRQRMEDAAGGKLDNVQPLQTRTVDQQRSKVRIEAPPPGMFIEAAGSGHGGSRSTPRRRRLDSSDSGSDGNSSISTGSRLSSSLSASSSRGPYTNGNGLPLPPPPPPPPAQFGFDESAFPDDDPVPQSLLEFREYRDHSEPRRGKNGFSGRPPRAESVRSSFYGGPEDDMDMHRVSMSSRISQSRRRVSGVDEQSAQSNLAAILAGRQPTSRRRRDSIESAREPSSDGRGRNAANGQDTEPTMTNAFAASLAAIRRNRADTMEDIDDNESVVSSRQQSGKKDRKRRDRSRKSQLSAEGKFLLQKAMAPESTSYSVVAASKSQSRKGLFDDSSSEGGDSDSDNGLFGIRKSDATSTKPSKTNSSRKSSSRALSEAGKSVRNLDLDSDSDSDEGSTMFTRQPKPSPTSPRSVVSYLSNGTNGASKHSRGSAVDVFYKSCIVQNQGKKSVGLYTFAYRFGDMEHSFTKSYNDLEIIHERLLPEIGGPRMPKMPSKHWYRNNTKPENMHKRAIEFTEYFKQLLAIHDIFENNRFTFEFHIPDDFVAAVRGSVPASSNSNSSPPTHSTIPPRPTAKPARTATQSRQRAASTKKSSALFGSSDDSDSDDDAASIVSASTTRSVATKKNKYVAPPEEFVQMRTSRNGDQSQSVRRRDRSRASSRASVRSSMNGSRRNLGGDPAPLSKVPIIPPVTGLPPRPNLFGGGRDDLLAAIRQGKDLKKATSTAVDAPGPVTPAFPAAAPPVLSPPPTAPHPPALGPAGSVAEAITNAMAARRIHVEYEDDNSDDSDDDWD